MNYLNVPGVSGYNPQALNIKPPTWQTPGFNPNAVNMGPVLNNPVNTTPGAIDAAANYQPGILNMTDPVPDLKDQSRIPGLGDQGGFTPQLAGLLGNVLSSQSQEQPRPQMQAAPVAVQPGAYRPFDLWNLTRRA